MVLTSIQLIGISHSLVIKNSVKSTKNFSKRMLMKTITIHFIDRRFATLLQVIEEVFNACAYPMAKVMIRLFLALCITLFLFNTSNAFASVDNIVATVSMDGTAPFDANNNPGNDASEKNGIIRTQDTFEYLITYDAVDTSEVTFTLTLPAGVYWHYSATATSVCNGSGGGFLDATGRILTCYRKPASIAQESFYVRALPGAIKNGEVFTATVKASGRTAISESLTVSATPKIDLWMIYNNHTKTLNGTTLGVLYTANFEFGAYENINSDLKGIESVEANQTIVLEVGPGSVPYNCSICSQVGGPGTPITITKTINNSFVRYNGNLVGSPAYIGQAKFRGLGLHSIQIFTPYDPYFPIGETTALVAKTASWDPLSLSGVSNFGTGYATGYDPSVTCPSSGTYVSAQRPCMRFMVDRTQSVKLLGSYHGVISGTTDDKLFGDNADLTNSSSIGSESVVPGQTFRAMLGVYNDYTAETAASNVGACVVWNPVFMNLTGAATIKLKSASGGNFYGAIHLVYANVASNKIIVEYAAKSFASDAERKSFDCGKAGDGASGWFTNPSSVPGGLASVSNIRIKYLDALNPNDLIGLVVPLMRPTSAESLALGAGNAMPWFIQHYSDQSALVKSNYIASGISTSGGRVNSIDSFLRHTAVLGASSIAPGTSTTLTITPVVVGPVGSSINTTSNSAKITVNMPNTCLEPMPSSLPSNATYTPATLGADGLACTGDSGEAPGKVVLNLGTVTAYGGSVGPFPYQGHANFLTPLQFSVLASSNSPVQALSFTSSATASNDISPSDGNYSKTINHSLTISGAAAFSVTHSVSGVVNNKVAANDSFTYTINFGNGGATAAGRGRFVFLLPYDEDNRGTLSLGEGKLQVLALSAGMATSTQGSVSIEYSLDSAVSIQSALASTNNEDGAININWTAYSGGALPANITAVRFITSGSILSGYGGFGSIQVKAPSVQSNTKIVSNVWGRTEIIGNDINTVKAQRGVAPVTLLGQDAGSLRGKVYFDLNANGVQDNNEGGVEGALVSLKCNSGNCSSALQGTDFSMRTDASGAYQFDANTTNKIFANANGSGTALTNFLGVIAGNWTITQIPPSHTNLIRVSSTVGSVNNTVTGTAGVRSISSIVMPSSAIGNYYNFGERQEHGKISVTKALTLPTGVNGPFSFTFVATCDQPTANSTYSATLTNYPTIKTVDILNIPAQSSCVLSETLPADPLGFNWVTPTFSTLTPAGTMPAAGVQTINAVNHLVSAVSIKKSVMSLPSAVSGSASLFDVKYKIEVSNNSLQASTYSLSELFGFDTDVSIVGAVTVVPSANVTNSVVAGFNGTSNNKIIINNESIAGGSSSSPTVETFEVTVRINVDALNSSNNSCNLVSGAGFGLFGTATLIVGELTASASACSNTPLPLGGKLTVNHVLDLPNDVTGNYNFSFKATCDLPTAGSEFTASLIGAPTNNKVDILNIPAGAVCTISQTEPNAPNGYVWNNPEIGAISPAGAMAIGGQQSLTVSNSVSNAITVSKTIDAPVAVSGSTDQFDVTYHIRVTNTSAAAITYNLDDIFEFDSDIEVLSSPTITKSANISGTVNTSFNGGSNQRIITGESISAASGIPLSPVVETFDVKVRIKLKGFNDANNLCNGAGTGLFNTAKLTSGSITRLATVCSATPNVNDGKLVVTKSFNLPEGVSGPFNFHFKATCDKPTANSVYSANMSYVGRSSNVEITAIPAGASCTLTETLPSPPAGFSWKTPEISGFSPVGLMPAGGSQVVTVTNELVTGVSVSKSYIGMPTQVTGSLNQFDASYKIEVSNASNSTVTYSLNDLFAFDPNIKIITIPEVTKSASVSQTLVSGFDGTSAHSSIVSGETIAAATDNIPVVETFIVKYRFTILSMDISKKTCNGNNGNGLMSRASISFGSSSSTASACYNTPKIDPVYFKIRVDWVGGKEGDTMLIPATSGFKSANTSAFKVVNSKVLKNSKLGSNSLGESSAIAVAPSETGVLPVPKFEPGVVESDYSVSAYSCTDGMISPITVAPNSSITVPDAAMGRNFVCTVTNTFIETTTTLEADPPSGSTIKVGDIVSYTMKTTVVGSPTLKAMVLTDVLDAGLTLKEKSNECTLKGRVLTCTLPAGTGVGEHQVSFKAAVNTLATKNRPAGIKNTASTNFGACSACTVTHSMVEIDTSKHSSADGKKGVLIGDVITYKVSVVIKGGDISSDIKITDTRSVGLSVSTVPENCSQRGLTITCVIPSGSKPGTYHFIYDATVTKDAKQFVSNQAFADQGTCRTSCSTHVKVIREVMLRLTKTANVKRVKIADFVRYEVLVENLTGPDANDFFILDQAAPGLSFVEGSLRVEGDESWSQSGTFPLKITKLDLAQNEKIIISYMMRVNAGAGRGELINAAWADHAEKYVTSNKATAMVIRSLDPDFEETRINGVVFNDKNQNGIQDADENGISGVRVAMTTGAVVETDGYGRYRFEAIDPGNFARGRNLIVKVDQSSLPSAYEMTTQNPLVKRVTPGLPIQFNFGFFASQ